jgi:hypothetical protein
VRLACLFPLIFACNGGLSKVGSEQTDADADGDADADSDTIPNVDPDQSAAEQLHLQPNAQCAQFVDSDGIAYDVAGATSYFAGQYTISDEGQVRGWEWWILFPNDTWSEASGAQDCQIAWAVSGNVVDPGPGCPACDFGIQATARMDMSITDCIDEFTNYIRQDADTEDLYYDVNTLGSHDATFYYASGNELANGPVDGDKYTWVTDSACKWF